MTEPRSTSASWLRASAVGRGHVPADVTLGERALIGQRVGGEVLFVAWPIEVQGVGAFRICSVEMAAMLVTARHSRAWPTTRRADHPPTSTGSTAGRTGRSSPESNRFRPCPR